MPATPSTLTGTLDTTDALNHSSVYSDLREVHLTQLPMTHVLMA